MTVKEAIRELKIQFVGEYDRQREAKDMAIKALEQQHCEDAISRTSVQETITDSLGRGQNTHQLWQRIQDLPPVTVQEKVGKWIYDGYYECSECGYLTYNDNYKYCPNCGAKMGKVGETDG